LRASARGCNGWKLCRSDCGYFRVLSA
jgi:hypothetical protein